MSELIVTLICIVVGLGPFCLVLWMGYHFVSLRLKRQERSRLFLNLLETGLTQGQAIEQTIISISKCRDDSMGIYFHLLALHLREGTTGSEALKKVPQLLPPQIAAMLQAGLKIGDVRKVFPACHRLLRDAVSQTRGAINYLVMVGFIGFPINLVLFSLLQIYVLPQFMSVLESVGGTPPSSLVWLIHHKIIVAGFQVFLFVVVWTAVVVYLDGTRLASWLDRRIAPITHWITYRLPWRRKRLQRDFSAMLAILLDAGMPEPEALAAAADCTANRIFEAHARRAARALQSGVKLAEAVQMVDESGEFRWRLANALHARHDFFNAISGWNESLDAKAFQEEQATAQTVTTGIVLLNGVTVGFIVVSIFSALISIINAGVLW